MANVNATTASLTLTAHTAFINNPQISDADFGVLGKVENSIDFGILATQNLFVDQFFGVIGSQENTSDIDLGVLGKNLSEVDVGVLGRGIVEANWGVLALANATIGLVIPWSQNMPIRTTQDALEEYETVEPLPIAYGIVPLKPVQFSKDRTEWLVSDLPVRGVQFVEIDQVEDKEFLFRIVQDISGREVSIIKFNNPTPIDSIIRVVVEGRVNPFTNNLMTNTADIIWDILNNIVGFEVPFSTFDRFRTEIFKLGYEFSGVINEPDRTIAGQIEEICSSAGAVVSVAMEGLARVYPRIV